MTKVSGFFFGLFFIFCLFCTLCKICHKTQIHTPIKLQSGNIKWDIKVNLSKLQVILYTVQLQSNNSVESSVTNNSPCRKFSYKQAILYKVQLQTSHCVESTARNLWRDHLETRHPVVATNKSLCRNFSYILREFNCKNKLYRV